ncbi:hypothetical protein PVT67_01835 [Gallaecimonas kandeliae]|uniref:hypothetical protein n=1 Tax=Gallaecimonas kandeliae TaxID=3029055 RepID=UPI0026486BD8|nr:hypothetical protein [Gallaecimonas kandeliae]WKE66014.1 hypothetical protein PVT67_01835 [Gallaecimonas kandeliae]
MNITERLESLSLRERLLVLLAGLVLLVTLVGLSWLQPLLADNQTRARANGKMAAELANLAQSIAALEAKLAEDPNAQLQAEIGRLKALRQTQQQAIYAKTKALVPADAMAPLLEALLKGRGDLQLVSLSTLPAQPLLGDKMPQGLYRHDLELKFKGGFLPTLKFLSQAEQLPWQFYWQSLSFRQTTYPDAEILIHVYTLGTSPHYLGA